MITNKNERLRHPEWIRSKMPGGKTYGEIEGELKDKKLHTVCVEARCPNISACWNDRTSTIMILGDTCTRACKFCNVKTGNPKGLLDPTEPQKSAEMVRSMNLRYVVITSVDRDDLPDHGAAHFAATVCAVKALNPQTKVEVLIPDFAGIPAFMDILAASEPFVIAQNLETVKSLTSKVRDRRASYERTLDVLKYYKQHFPHIATKSSLMVGLGETLQEIDQAFLDLRNADVDIVTLGQYLQPSRRHLPVERYYHPDEFTLLKEMAYKRGFKFVAAGPFVRSSYKAADFLDFMEKKQ